MARAMENSKSLFWGQQMESSEKLCMEKEAA